MNISFLFFITILSIKPLKIARLFLAFPPLAGLNFLIFIVSLNSASEISKIKRFNVFSCLISEKFFFGDALFLRFQPTRVGEHRGGATYVDVMYNAVEWLGGGRRWDAAATVSGLQGLIKGVVLALVKVRPEAACRTCCLDGIIESSNLAKKSMPRRGVATAASKKSNSKFWPEKQMVRRRKTQAGICLPLAPTWCGPVGGAELECGRIETYAP